MRDSVTRPVRVRLVLLVGTVAVAVAAGVLLAPDGWVVAVLLLAVGGVVDVGLRLRSERVAAAARHAAVGAALRAGEERQQNALEALKGLRSSLEEVDRRLAGLETALEASTAAAASSSAEAATSAERLELGLRRVDEQCVSLRWELDRATSALARDSRRQGGEPEQATGTK